MASTATMAPRFRRASSFLLLLGFLLVISSLFLSTRDLIGDQPELHAIPKAAETVVVVIKEGRYNETLLIPQEGNHSSPLKPTSSLVATGDTIDPNEWSKLKVAMYMTSHGSDKHLKFIYNCWPAAIEHLPLLQSSHLIYYTSAEPPQDALDALSFKSITVKRYTELSPSNATYEMIARKKQVGAMRAMVDPFAKENRWFDGYDWVIRLNPDVLIRSDTWIRQTLLNSSVDGIFIDYNKGRHPNATKGLNSDFYAFRPQAVDFEELQANIFTMKTAETHLYKGFQHSIRQERVAWLPNAESRNGWARVIGRKSPVIHFHPLFKACPHYFDATFQNIY